MKKKAVTVSDRVGSREAVERAIEKSKDGASSRWEKQSHLPRWGHDKREEERPASAAMDRRN